MNNMEDEEVKNSPVTTGVFPKFVNSFRMIVSFNASSFFKKVRYLIFFCGVCGSLCRYSLIIRYNKGTLYLCEED